MSNLDIIREKLDGGQFTDLEELASGLLAALEAVAEMTSNARTAINPSKVSAYALESRISYWTDEFAAPVQTCAYETYAATLETPAEFCEEYAVEDSEYCEEHGA